MEQIMDRLGHSNDDTTRNVYLHVTKEMKKKLSEVWSTNEKPLIIFLMLAKRLQGANATRQPSVEKGFRQSLHHAAHSTHAAHIWHAAASVFFWLVGYDCFCSQEQCCNGCCVL